MFSPPRHLSLSSLSLSFSFSLLLLLSFFSSSSYIVLVSSGACTVQCRGDDWCPPGCTDCTYATEAKDCTGSCTSGDCDTGAGYFQIDECRWTCCAWWNIRKTCRKNCRYKTSNCVDCKPNFWGWNCQACPNCNSGSCRSGMNGDGGCNCPQGATGQFCQYTNAGTCSGRGIARWDGSCQCNEGYAGSNCGSCATDWYPLQGTGTLTCQKCIAANTCKGAGRCATNPSSGRTCDCNPNYSGSTCDTCAANAYRVNGQCIFCTRDATCNSHGSCTSSATCQCDSIYTGTSCDTCSNGRFNYPTCSECPGGAATPCNNRGTCDRVTGRCTCQANYAGDACNEPKILTIYPTEGVTQGNTRLDITGTSFGTSGSVRIGVTICGPALDGSPIVWTDTAIRCWTPPGYYSRTGVAIIISRSQPSTASNQNQASITYYKYSAPTLLSVTPSPISSVGGTANLLTLTGDNFGIPAPPPGSGSVPRIIQITNYAGRAEETTLSRDSTLPTHQSMQIIPLPGVGASSIVIEIDTVRSAVIPFRYAQPKISNINPPTAPCIGGTKITITGANFGPSAVTPTSATQPIFTVTLGGALCTSLIRTTDHTVATCNLPGGYGTLPVRMCVADSCTDTVGLFAYEPPSITSIESADCGTPLYGPDTVAGCDPKGGNTLTINGKNFGTTTAASMASMNVYISQTRRCTNVNIINDARMTCKTPAGVGYNHSITVQRESQPAFTKENYFSYQGPLLKPNTLAIVTLNAGTCTSGTGSGSVCTLNNVNFPITVQMDGNNFGTDPNDIHVYYGYVNPGTSTIITPYECTVVSVIDTRITCNVAPGVGRSLVFQIQRGTVWSSISSDRLSYPSPILQDNTLHLLGRPKSRFVTGNTTSGDIIAFDGEFFGYNQTQRTIFYGPSSRPEAYQCYQLGGDAYTNNVTCQLSPGDGENLMFKICVGIPGAPDSRQCVRGTDVYNYPQAPLILSVSGCPTNQLSGTINCPTDGKLSGKQVRITVTGNYFLLGGATVTVGGLACLNPIQPSPDEQTIVTCDLPAGAGREQDVVVTSLSGLFSRPFAKLSYAAPTLESIAGCTSDETGIIDCSRTDMPTITLTGTNFGANGAKVLIGGVSCSNVTHDPITPHTHVTCEIPQGTGVQKSVFLIQNDGDISSISTSVLLSYAPCQPGTHIAGLGCDPCIAGTYADVSGMSNCRNCSAGTYSLDGATLCDKCPPGNYTALEGQASCTPCAAGRYALLPGQVDCVPCAVGTYAALEGQSACDSCSPGSKQSELGNTTCDRCPPGSYQVSSGQSHCSLCDEGKYQPAEGQASCRLCGKGKVTSLDPNTPVRGATECVECDAGKFTDAEGSLRCTLCPSGKFSSATGQSSCVDCSPGYYNEQEGRSKCETCGSGNYTDVIGASRCSLCPLGTFSNGTAISACQPCPAGSYQNVQGQTLCRECDPGTSQPSMGQPSCVACLPGSFTNLTGQTQCTRCPMGYRSATPTTGNSHCVPCERGKYSVSEGTSSCLDCTPAKYAANNGSTSCDSCMEGYSAPDPGMSLCIPCSNGTISANHSQYCSPCDVGSFAPAPAQTTCQPCSLGYYQPNQGQSACLACPPGTQTAQNGNGAALVSCVDCQPGEYSSGYASMNCSRCDAGRFSVQRLVNTTDNSYLTGATICTDCDPGYYISVPGGTRCFPCAIGRYTGSTATKECTQCAAGSFGNETGLVTCPLCPAGQYSTVSGSTVCEVCKPGTYNNVSGLQECYQCPKGRYQTYSGQSRCEACAVGTVQPSDGAYVCDPCVNGTFANSTGLTACLDCAPGTSSNVQGASSCSDCPAGFYAKSSKQTACEACEAGSYSTSIAAVSCSPCGRGKYSAYAGSAQCDTCGVGFIAPNEGSIACDACWNGTYAATRGLSKCDKCSRGRFQTLNGQSQCLACPAGRATSDEGRSEPCTPCEPGDHAPQQGMETCQACGVGKFSGVPGAANCSLCAAGSFSLTGYKACALCATGRYTDYSGASECSQCSIGRFQSQTNSTACNECLPGRYAGQPGQSQCRPCDTNENSVAPDFGMSQCLTCSKQAKTNAPINTLCQCPVSTYLLTDNTNCTGCPYGTSCILPGITWYTLPTARGFWRPRNTSLDYYRCILPQHCLGGHESTCGINREGPICAVCSLGFRASTRFSECAPCPAKGQAVGTSVGVIIALVAVLIIMYALVLRTDRQLIEAEKQLDKQAIEWDHVYGVAGILYDTKAFRSTRNLNSGVEAEAPSDAPRASVENNLTLVASQRALQTLASRTRPNFTYKMKIVIGFLQIATNLAFVVEVPWPSTYLKFINALDFVNLDFIPWQSVGCATLFDYYTKFLVVTLVPFGVMAALAIFFLLPLYIMDYRDMSDDESRRASRKRSRRQFIKLMLFTVFLLYPNVSSTVLSMFVCRRVDGVSYLNADFTLICYDERWMRYLPVAVIMTIIYPIGIPVILGSMIYYYRHQLATPGIRLQLGFLFEAYHYGAWWFELADMLHKLILTSIVAFFPQLTQMPIGMGASMVYTIILLIVRPYTRKMDDMLHMLCQVELYLLMLMGYVLSVQIGTDLDLDPVTDAVMSAILILMVIAIFLLFLILIGINVRKLFRHFQRRHVTAEENVADVKKQMGVAEHLAFINPLHELAQGDGTPDTKRALERGHSLMGIGSSSSTSHSRNSSNVNLHSRTSSNLSTITTSPKQHPVTLSLRNPALTPGATIRSIRDRQSLWDRSDDAAVNPTARSTPQQVKPIPLPPPSPTNTNTKPIPAAPPSPERLALQLQLPNEPVRKVSSEGYATLD